MVDVRLVHTRLCSFPRDAKNYAKRIKKPKQLYLEAPRRNSGWHILYWTMLVVKGLYTFSELQDKLQFIGVKNISLRLAFMSITQNLMWGEGVEVYRWVIPRIEGFGSSPVLDLDSISPVLCTVICSWLSQKREHQCTLFYLDFFLISGIFRILLGICQSITFLPSQVCSLLSLTSLSLITNYESSVG